MGVLSLQFEEGSAGGYLLEGCDVDGLTTPSWGARMLCYIFMASTTQTSCPRETRGAWEDADRDYSSGGMRERAGSGTRLMCAATRL